MHALSRVACSTKRHPGRTAQSICTKGWWLMAKHVPRLLTISALLVASSSSVLAFAEASISPPPLRRNKAWRQQTRRPLKLFSALGWRVKGVRCSRSSTLTIGRDFRCRYRQSRSHSRATQRMKRPSSRLGRFQTRDRSRSALNCLLPCIEICCLREIRSPCGSSIPNPSVLAGGSSATGDAVMDTASGTYDQGNPVCKVAHVSPPAISAASH
jgi:hypothetical protein